MKEIIEFLPKPADEDYRKYFPLELSSRADLEKLRPDPEWAELFLIKDPNLAQREHHGFGHNGRIIILQSLLLPKIEDRLKKEGAIISQEQKAALLLSAISHDFGHEKDFELRLEAHQQRSAKRDWLEIVFFDLRRRDIDLFKNVNQLEVITLASQMNRVHDERNDTIALRVLRKEYAYNLRNLPLELDIFKDIDSGLEKLRTEEWFNKWYGHIAEIVVKVLKGGLLRPEEEKSLFHLLHFPHFEETRQLLPFALRLYQLSTKNPEYKKDQWKTTMDTAQMLGGIRE